MTHSNLSIIVPAFNEAAIIADTLDALARYLEANPQLGSTEVIVVAAGTDETATIARQYADRFQTLKVITPSTPGGKGRDVRLGFQAAHGTYQLFTDADLSTPLRYIADAVTQLEAGADVVIGRRNLRSIHQQKLRTLISIASNRLIRLLLLPGIYDSQCGFKGFRATVAQRLFTNAAHINGWAFDTEILRRARQDNVRIIQLPIPTWRETRADNLRNDRLVHAITTTLGDIVHFRLKLWLESWGRWINYIIAATALASGGLSLLIGMRQSVWLDEAYSIALAERSFSQIVHFTSLDVHPPLYYFLLKVWTTVFGENDLVLRSFSALCCALAVGISLLLIKRLWSARTTVVVVPFVLLAPFILRYGFEIRMYALASLIGIAATYALVVAMEAPPGRQRILYWILYALLVAAGMYTLYYTALLWIAHLLWCLFAKQPRGHWVSRFTQPWVAAYGLAVLLFLPWIPAFFHQLHSVQSNFWIPPIDYRQVINIGSLSFSYLTEWQLGALGSLIFLTTLTVTLYFIISAFRAADAKHRRYLGLLLLYTVVPVAVMYLVSLPPLRPLFLERYISQTIIGGYLLLGVSITMVLSHRPTLRHWIAAGYIVVVLAAGVVTLYHAGNYNFEELYKPNARDIASYINHHSDSDIAVMTDGPEPYLPLRYYLINRTVLFYSSQPTLPYGGYAMLHDSPQWVHDASIFHKRTLWLIYRGQQPVYVPTGQRPALVTQLGRYMVALYD